MRAYGILLLSWSLFVLIESITGGFFLGMTVESTGALFVLTALAIGPAVVTYTKLGLNDDPSVFRKADPVVTRNREIMRSHFKYWSLIQNTAMALIGLSVVIALLLPGWLNPFQFFVAILGLLGSAWSLIAYPVASELLSQEET